MMAEFAPSLRHFVRMLVQPHQPTEMPFVTLAFAMRDKNPKWPRCDYSVLEDLLPDPEARAEIRRVLTALDEGDLVASAKMPPLLQRALEYHGFTVGFVGSGWFVTR